MKTQMTGQVTINAPARAVWHIVAEEFHHIGQWTTAIAESHAATQLPPPDGATVGGRVCLAPGFGEVHEMFTRYDEDGMRFTYQATAGLPGFIEYAENNWAVYSLGRDKCRVAIRAELRVKLFPGLLLAPLFKFQLNRAAGALFEELKYLAENGQPHPRKLKARQKQLQRP